jgi:predicted AAA+ superfamily ATPase
VVKQPKLYFYDTGLLCALLDIQSAEQLASHYPRGNIFESMVVAEYLKLRWHAGIRSNAHFWRDNTGHEVDLLLEEGQSLRAVEIKSGETLNDTFFRGLRYFKRLSREPDEHFILVHGGSRRQTRRHGQVLGWQHISDLLQG